MHILYVKGRCTTKRFPGNLYPKVLVARVPQRWTDIGLDLNPFRRRDMKDKPYKWGYSRDSFWA